MKSKFMKKPPVDQDMALQITSMADIFMILLVFLLKSYSSSVSTVSASGNVQLPTGKSADVAKETLKLEVGQSAILVDEKPVVPLKDFEITAGQVTTPDGQLDALYQVFINQRKHLPTPNMDSTLLVFADERTPFSTLKTILASAASSGFVDLQLVVVDSDSQ